MRRAYFQGIAIATVAFMLLLPTLTVAAPAEYAAFGQPPDLILPVINAFRTILGGANNGGTPGPIATGRREINWDGTPEANAAPNFISGDLFKPSRGLSMSSQGPAFQGFQVSAGVASPIVPVLFGNINPQYPTLFQFFSPERIFTAVGSNQLDLRFFVPGSNTRATVGAFGAVFIDVQLQFFTRMQYFDQDDNLLHTFFVPAAPNTEKTLHFVGAGFTEERICRVRITTGTVPLSRASIENPVLPFVDVVAMDDFIYAEPKAGTCAN